MNHRHALALLGFLLIAVGMFNGGWYLLMVWFGLDFLLLGVAHFKGWHRIFGKLPNGKIAIPNRILFLPLLLYINAVWHVVRLLSREPAVSVIDDDLVVGRRLLPRENNQVFDNFVDLTAEFVEPAVFRHSESYFSFPILDASGLCVESLHAAVCELRPGTTFIHCAQGHGRTGLFSLALLMHRGKVKNPEDGLKLLQSSRPAIDLSTVQWQCIKEFEHRYFET